MKKTIVVAVSENNVIGKDNDLIWHMPADLKWFKQQTKGHWVLMGRRSFESIGSKPLPNRTHIIVTQQEDYELPEGVYRASSLSEGYRIAEDQGADELMILGGGKIYKQALPDCTKIILTEIKSTFEGDTYFPKIDRTVWAEVYREDHKADEKNPYDYAFTILEKIS
jgi:dihydrofolate reductase